MVARTMLLCLLGAAQGLLPSALSGAHHASRVSSSRLLTMLSPAQEKKAVIVDEVKEMMAESSLLIAAHSEGMPVNMINDLRQKLPEEIKLRVVKNTLIQRAAADFEQFGSAVDPLCARSNFWIFVPETHMREGVKLWNDFVDENKKEGNAIVGGVFGGDYLDADGVDAISKLPTKQELMGSVAIMLKKMPQKLAAGLHQAGAERVARGIKEAQGSKLARAVKAIEGSGKLS
jgi:large subunit ribosomal protein L10